MVHQLNLRETVIISFFFSNTFHVVEDFVMTSLFWFWFVIPNFCLTVPVFWDPSQRDAPAFLSLLYRFWLGGLFSFERLTVYVIENHPCLLIPKECFLFFDVVRCVTNWEFSTSMRVFSWINWDTTLPRVYIKGFDCSEQKTPTSLARRGWLGIIFLITPVFGNWKNACTSSARSVQKHTVWEYGIVSSSSL